MKDDLVERAINIWLELTENPDAMRAFRARQKKILDEGAVSREAKIREQEAYERSYEKAYQEGIEKIALALLAKDRTIEEVSEITGMDKEKVLEIQHYQKDNCQ